ncbi:DJ-1 family glyoxalase III [Marinomonas algicola]|uniref:DJ-1 family glyoxalase III n=1 Tax=Marinomonas algicola TaxID=2773454 RepID=UPI00174B1F8F|nr:DJ-1 family glyoxalase III [Marinomonas algicola]
MTTLLVPIADGSEDIEIVTIIDVLRRGKVEVVVASVHERKAIQAARGTKIEADVLLVDVAETMFDAIALPGGMPGAEHLRDSHLLVDILEKHDIHDALLAAICAAPAVVLGTHGFLVDKQATCYPGFEAGLTGADYIPDQPVVMDGNILTSTGPATAMTFALSLLANLKGYDIAQEVADQLLC